MQFPRSIPSYSSQRHSPEVAPAGTLAKMIEELQLAVVAAEPLKVTVPDEPKPLAADCDDSPDRTGNGR